MAYFAGLDVSVKETRVCIVDDAGKIVRERSCTDLAVSGGYEATRAAAMTAFAKSWRDDKAQNSSLRFRASHLRHQWLEAAGERRQRFPTTSARAPSIGEQT
jgi:hypothetical protein